MGKTIILLGALASGLLAACAHQPPTVGFIAIMSAVNEVPPTRSVGLGSATATLTPGTGYLQWQVVYRDLTGPATAAHFHCPGAPGQSAPVAVPFHNSLASPITGVAMVNGPVYEALVQNQCYINIHTAAFPGGEIRGQLVRTN